MTGKGVVRSIKNYAKGFSEVQRKVREATSNDPWGPSGTLMNEIAQLTYTQQEFIEIMDMIDKRLNDKGKNWRHVFKALLLLDYCLHVGSENVVLYAKENIYVIKTLKEFQHVDDNGRDVGANVRQKAKDITNLLMDDARLKEERRQRQQMRDRMAGVNDYMNDIMGGNAGQQQHRSRAHRDDSEDRDLQRAIEESKRMAEEEERKRLERQGEEDLAKAIRLSEQEAQERERKEKEKLEKDNFDKLFGNTNGSATQSNSSFNPFPQSQSFDSAFNPYANQQQQQQQPPSSSPWSQSQPFESSANPYTQQSQWPQTTGFTNTNFGTSTSPFGQQPPQQQALFSQVTGMPNNPYQQQHMTSNPYQQMNNGFGQGLQAQMTGMPSFQTNMMTGLLPQQQQNQTTGFATAFQTQQPAAAAAASNNPFGQLSNNNQQQQQQQFPTTSNSFGSSMFGQTLTASPSLASATLSSSSPSQSFASTTAGGPTRSFTFPSSPALQAQQQLQQQHTPSANDSKYATLNALLANRDDGTDTFGNTGNLRIPYGSGFASSIKPQSSFQTGGQPI